MKVVAVIPTYNAENTIAGIANSAKSFCDEVVVVDDCSTDGSFKIVQGLGVKYALHQKNMGAGGATRTGIGMAKGLGADIVITLDSDWQHDPSEIPVVLVPIKENKADIVIGSRFMPRMVEVAMGENEVPYAFSTHYFERQEYKAGLRKIPAYRKFGIDVIIWLYNAGCKQRVTDSLSCFRAYNKKALELIEISENGFGFSTEVLIKARKLGLKIMEVPISCIYHKDCKQDSTMNPFRCGLEIAWKTILWRIKCIS